MIFAVGVGNQMCSSAGDAEQWRRKPLYVDRLIIHGARDEEFFTVSAAENAERVVVDALLNLSLEGCVDGFSSISALGAIMHSNAPESLVNHEVLCPRHLCHSFGEKVAVWFVITREEQCVIF